MEQPVKKGLPPWFGTFSDLCLLLMTFFVLLLSFANMDITKFKEMLGSVQQAFGVTFEVRGQYQAARPVNIREQTRQQSQQQSQQNVFHSTALSQQGGGGASRTDQAEVRAMADQVRRLAKAESLGRSLEVHAGANGVRLRVKGQLLFGPGGARIKGAAKRLLDGIAKVMARFNYYLVVEGHTDSVPINTPQFPSNWELSGARAAAVLRYLVGRGVAERRVSAVGFAANYPISSNNTARGRQRNRRVEFVFTKHAPRIAVN